MLLRRRVPRSLGDLKKEGGRAEETLAGAGGGDPDIAVVEVEGFGGGVDWGRRERRRGGFAARRARWRGEVGWGGEGGVGGEVIGGAWGGRWEERRGVGEEEGVLGTEWRFRCDGRWRGGGGEAA